VPANCNSSYSVATDNQKVVNPGLVHGWVRWHAKNGEQRFCVTESTQLGRTCIAAPCAEAFVKSGSAQVAIDGARLLVLIARPDAVRLSAPLRNSDAGDGSAQALLALWTSDHESIAGLARGRFAIVAIDLEMDRAYLAVDRFGTIPMYFAFEGDRLAFADRAEQVSSRSPAQIEPQALLRYVHFHCLPAPGTIFRGVQRLRAAEEAIADSGEISIRSHWRPAFEEVTRPFAELKEEFRSLLRTAVRREVGSGESIGSFLSGGTDSSTVTGLLCEITGRPARAYSIGFHADGYDEMAYARIAAQHFGADHRVYYVTPDDLVRSIPEVAAYFDQPFGNSSALPALYCARLAHADGVRRILAGDGGDELFGGNSRYAKQKIFDLYQSIPKLLREGVIEPLLLENPLTGRLPLTNKARSYIAQAKVPMPARLETYNLLQRIGPANLFTRDFLQLVELEGPAREQDETYARVGEGSLINRMLAYDWQYTLSDSDLPKVCGTTEMAGLEVGFPMLDDGLLEFSLRLRSNLKVKGLTLRYFFKEALRGFLPDEILRKSKHGFGLPFGIWLTQHNGLQALVRDALSNLGDRGFIRPEYLRELEQHVEAHAGYYGELVWILTTLEHWLRAHAPTYRLR